MTTEQTQIEQNKPKANPVNSFSTTRISVSMGHINPDTPRFVVEAYSGGGLRLAGD